MTDTSESMVERVARAICASDFDGDTAVYDEMSAAQRENFTVNARAAIEAMREPTDAMLMAAGLHGGSTTKGRYRAMIDASLHEGEAER